jgi:5-methylcytosine-specific restriction enzyme A
VSRPQGFTPDAREIIANRASDYNGHPVCEVMAVCQGVTAEAAHHRRPRGAGGSRRPDTNQAANGIAVCNADHDYIESHREESLRNGWLVLQCETPAEKPVLRRGVFVFLDDYGNLSRCAAPVATPEPETT